jgi:hypothetical protein
MDQVFNFRLDLFILGSNVKEEIKEESPKANLPKEWGSGEIHGKNCYSYLRAFSFITLKKLLFNLSTRLLMSQKEKISPLVINSTKYKIPKMNTKLHVTF